MLPVHQRVPGAYEGHQIPWNQSHSQLQAATWVLAIELGRAASTFNRRAISPATVASVSIQLGLNEGLC